MEPSTEHERPAKRVKSNTGGALTPPSNSRRSEDPDVEEPGIVLDDNVAHRSDLYLDTV
jgi:hypothetical protein